MTETLGQAGRFAGPFDALANANGITDAVRAAQQAVSNFQMAIGTVNAIANGNWMGMATNIGMSIANDAISGAISPEMAAALPYARALAMGGDPMSVAIGAATSMTGTGQYAGMIGAAANGNFSSFSSAAMNYGASAMGMPGVSGMASAAMSGNWTSVGTQALSFGSETSTSSDASSLMITGPSSSWSGLSTQAASVNDARFGSPASSALDLGLAPMNPSPSPENTEGTTNGDKTTFGSAGSCAAAPGTEAEPEGARDLGATAETVASTPGSNGDAQKAVTGGAGSPQAEQASEQAYNLSAFQSAEQRDNARFAVEEAKRQGVDPALALAILQTESGGRSGLVSPVGARGPMQLMPSTAAGLGVNPDDPRSNIRGGITYIKTLKNQFGNDPATIAAAYNAGPGRTARSLRDTGKLPDIPETNNYVRNVSQRTANYRQGVGDMASADGAYRSSFSERRGCGDEDLNRVEGEVLHAFGAMAIAKEMIAWPATRLGEPRDPLDAAIELVRGLVYPAVADDASGRVIASKARAKQLYEASTESIGYATSSYIALEGVLAKQQILAAAAKDAKSVRSQMRINTEARILVAQQFAVITNLLAARLQTQAAKSITTDEVSNWNGAGNTRTAGTDQTLTALAQQIDATGAARNALNEAENNVNRAAYLHNSMVSLNLAKREQNSLASMQAWYDDPATGALPLHQAQAETTAILTNNLGDPEATPIPRHLWTPPSPASVEQELRAIDDSRYIDIMPNTAPPAYSFYANTLRDGRAIEAAVTVTDRILATVPQEVWFNCRGSESAQECTGYRDYRATRETMILSYIDYLQSRKYAEYMGVIAGEASAYSGRISSQEALVNPRAADAEIARLVQTTPQAAVSGKDLAANAEVDRVLSQISGDPSRTAFVATSFGNTGTYEAVPQPADGRTWQEISSWINSQNSALEQLARDGTWKPPPPPQGSQLFFPPSNEPQSGGGN